LLPADPTLPSLVRQVSPFPSHQQRKTSPQRIVLSAPRGPRIVSHSPRRFFLRLSVSKNPASSVLAARCVEFPLPLQKLVLLILTAPSRFLFWGAPYRDEGSEGPILHRSASSLLSDDTCLPFSGLPPPSLFFYRSSALCVSRSRC